MNQSGIKAATVMAWAGVAVLVVGAIVWFSSTQIGYDPSGLMPGMDNTKPHLQSLGAGLVLIGAITGALGWAAYAVCTQIASTVERRHFDDEP